jgi:uncharacterized repeat protein (TIGR01451 family)
VANTPNANVGDTITYTITLVNGLGAGAAVSVFDQVTNTPGTTTALQTVSVNLPGFSDNIGTNKFSVIGSIPNGQTLIITATFLVTSGVIGGVIDNTAVYTAVGTNSGTASALVVIGPLPPVFTIDKVNNPTTVAPNGNIISTITITNSGTEVITGAIVTDTIPTGTTFISASPTPTTTTSSLLTWSSVTLPIGTTVFTVVTQVNQNVDSGTLLTDTATLNIPSESIILSTSATSQVVNNSSADLAITINPFSINGFPIDPFDVNNNNLCKFVNKNCNKLEYLIVLTNNGPSSANNVTFDLNIQTIDLKTGVLKTSDLNISNLNLKQEITTGIGTGFIILNPYTNITHANKCANKCVNFPIRGIADVVLPNTRSIFKLSFKLEPKCFQKLIYLILTTSVTSTTPDPNLTNNTSTTTTQLYFKDKK